MIAGTFDISLDLELNKRECLLQGKCDLEKLYGQTCQTRLSGLWSNISGWSNKTEIWSNISGWLNETDLQFLSHVTIEWKRTGSFVVVEIFLCFPYRVQPLCTWKLWKLWIRWCGKLDLSEIALSWDLSDSPLSMDGNVLGVDICQYFPRPFPLSSFKSSSSSHHHHHHHIWQAS